MTKEFIQKFAALITGAFSLLAALAWNDAIKEIIQKYISPGSDLISMIIYAIVVTIIAVIISSYINMLSEKIVKREEKLINQIKQLKKEVKEQCDNKEEK